MTYPPYPLTWPDGLPRTERKASSQFRTSLSAAINNVKKSLAAFGTDTGKLTPEELEGIEALIRRAREETM